MILKFYKVCTSSVRTLQYGVGQEWVVEWNWIESSTTFTSDGHLQKRRYYVSELIDDDVLVITMPNAISSIRVLVRDNNWDPYVAIKLYWCIGSASLRQGRLIVDEELITYPRNHNTRRYDFIQFDDQSAYGTDLREFLLGCRSYRRSARLGDYASCCLFDDTATVGWSTTPCWSFLLCDLITDDSSWRWWWCCKNIQAKTTFESRYFSSSFQTTLETFCFGGFDIIRESIR